jgi:hypothetical protein
MASFRNFFVSSGRAAGVGAGELPDGACDGFISERERGFLIRLKDGNGFVSHSSVAVRFKCRRGASEGLECLDDASALAWPVAPTGGEAHEGDKRAPREVRGTRQSRG